MIEAVSAAETLEASATGGPELANATQAAAPSALDVAHFAQTAQAVAQPAQLQPTQIQSHAVELKGASASSGLGQDLTNQLQGISGQLQSFGTHAASHTTVPNAATHTANAAGNAKAMMGELRATYDYAIEVSMISHAGSQFTQAGNTLLKGQ